MDYFLLAFNQTFKSFALEFFFNIRKEKNNELLCKLEIVQHLNRHKIRLRIQKVDCITKEEDDAFERTNKIKKQNSKDKIIPSLNKVTD